MTRARDNSFNPFNNQAAGKNVVINGAFDFWQRGTSFASSNSVYVFTADRWQIVRNGYTLGQTVTRQSSGLSGFNYCARVQRDSGNTSTQSIQFQSSFATEEVLRLQGQTSTLSFYARTGANFSASSNAVTILVAASTNVDTPLQSYSSNVSYPYNAAINLTGGTTWTRYFVNVIIPSNTTSAGVNLYYNPTGTAGAADYYEITGVQLEIGSTPTAFSRSGGTTQGELAACQRYYAVGGGDLSFSGVTTAGNGYYGMYYFPVDMRVTPSVTLTNANNAGPFGATPGGAGGTTTRYTREGRTAATSSSGYFGSSFFATAEL